MAPAASTIALGHGTVRSVSDVQTVSEKATERSVLLSAVMQSARSRLRGAKVAEQLATIMGCEPRTAARYLSGERVPGGNEVFAVLLHPKLGPPAIKALMDEAERQLTPADFQTFEIEMTRATLRAERREKGVVEG
jgi:hypothetical protein